MSVLVISEVPGGTGEQDAAMLEAIDFAHNPPDGVQARLAGPTANGWRIVGLWESRDAFDTYFRARVVPALESAGRSMSDPEFWEIDSVIIT